MINLAIVDDHPMVIEGLRNLLSSFEGVKIIFDAQNIKDMHQYLHVFKPDVMFLDINLPDGNGLDQVEDIKKKLPETKIIVFTSFKEVAYVKKALHLKVDGLIFKSAEPEIIKEAIIAVTKGKKYTQSEVLEMMEDPEKSTHPDALPYITKREMEILQLIADELTTKEISDKLCISVSTVETHRNNLLTKLGVKNAVGLVKTAYQKRLLL